MAGIYIHVPFCATRCIYCDFYTVTTRNHQLFVDSLVKEISLRKDYLGEQRVNTIYFGGGTPSTLSIELIGRIFDVLYRYFNIEQKAEITLEANPDDLNERYIHSLNQLPVNRLSLGLQTFNNEMLRFLKRRHTGQEAEAAVKRCQDAGYDNISVDLMYGLPKQTYELFHYDILRVLALDVPHLSAYHLIYEQGTKLFRMLKNGQVRSVEESLSLRMFSLLISELKKNGFEHYEISSFAQSGLYSRHNTGYWKGASYIGLGPSAHSFNGKNRQWNVSSLKKYAQGIEEGHVYSEEEPDSEDIRYNEMIMTGLRTMWGVDLRSLESVFGRERLLYCLKNAQKYVREGLIIKEGDILKLSTQGLFISDTIMSDLMWV